jgi:bifunctional non-homologous end joining protein LigD
LERDGVEPVVKTSGALGLHVAVPLAPGQSFEAAKAYARRLATELETSMPGLVIARMARAARTGKVFIDWVQNVPTRSTIAPWSLRAMPWPAVSAPLTWMEVERAASGHDEPVFGPQAALERFASLGDPFAPVLHGEMRVPVQESATAPGA